MTVVIGSSGFIGNNLIKLFPHFKELSMRSKNWRLELADASIFINLVGKAHDLKGTAIEEDYYYSNVELTKLLFEQFLSVKSAKLFIHISSLAAVEEFESNHEITELNVCNPQSWYGKSKRAIEIWLLNQELPIGKKVIILRPPMVHGPGDKGNLNLLYKFISRGIPYPLSAFKNERSFISIDNFLFFIDQIIKHHEKLETGIYHIADDETISTKDITSVIHEVTGKRTFNVSIPKFIIRLIAKLGDIIPIPLNSKRLTKMTSNLLVSNKKIKSALAIKHLPFTAKEGLIKTIKSFES